mgnify:CR=1 FL=1
MLLRLRFNQHRGGESGWWGNGNDPFACGVRLLNLGGSISNSFHSHFRSQHNLLFFFFFFFFPLLLLIATLILCRLAIVPSCRAFFFPFPCCQAGMGASWVHSVYQAGYRAGGNGNDDDDDGVDGGGHGQ